MNHSPLSIVWKFIQVVIEPRTYTNLLYLIAAFPLGIFYFVFLSTGLSTGFSLLIIWIGVPVLVITAAGWWLFANFERNAARVFLREDVQVKKSNTPIEHNTWQGILVTTRNHFVDPLTWKELLYLIVKFPLGVATFIVVVVFGSLTIALLISPFIYDSLQFFSGGGFLGIGLLEFQIDSIAEALVAATIGLLMLPVFLHVTNSLAWLHGKFANIMLSS